MKIKYFTTKFSYSIEFSKLLITKKKKEDNEACGSHA
jgi:hypothetical protein